MKSHGRECREAAKFTGSYKEVDGRVTEKFMGAGFLEQKQCITYLRLMTYQSAQAKLSLDVALCVWSIYDVYFVRLH